MTCDCRKPQPGLFHAAARDHDVTVPASYVVGDRAVDIEAAARFEQDTGAVFAGKYRVAAGDDAGQPVRADRVFYNLAAAVSAIPGDDS